MATKRKRGDVWEFVVKRKRLLPRPFYGTFETEQEGDEYCARLEALLDAGIVPPELVERGEAITTVADAIREYLHAVGVTDADRQQLGALYERHRTVKMARVDYAWCEDWIRSMKQEAVLSPSTIRHYVGALARCFDWVCRKHPAAMPANPLRMLPRNYATYTDADAVAAQAQGEVAREDVERDRRLMPARPPETRDEETRIRAILDGDKPAGRERALELRWQGALELLFTLALESAMRLREMYTLELRQVDLAARTVFLERTKNGDKRQVPLSSVAEAAIEAYLEQVRSGARGMAGFGHEDGRLFPWLRDAEREQASTAGPVQRIDDLPPRQQRQMLARVTSRLSRQFARVFDAAGCDDLHFHDLRHEATSRLYERTNLSDVEIARITGHRNLRMLKRYANLRASVLAERMW